MITLLPTSNDLAPGQYAVAHGVRRSKVTICCPGCEGEYLLARHYVVGGDGLLNPVLRCPLFGCSWEKSAMLAEWRRP